MDFFNNMMESVMGAEKRYALQVLKELLEDCRKAGFAEEEIRETRQTILWLLFCERLKPGSVVPKESGGLDDDD